MKKGFTLIEVIIAIAIVGILAMIIVPNVLYVRDQSKEQTVKHNCYVVQLAVADYHVKNGQFPESLEQIEQELANEIITNPFKSKQPGLTVNHTGEPIEGSVNYRSPSSLIDHPYLDVQYEIDGYGKHGNLIISLNDMN